MTAVSRRTGSTSANNAATTHASARSAAPRVRAIAVDGKCLRGARRPDGSRVFVLSAVTHGDGITLASREIAAKSRVARGNSAPRLSRNRA